MKGTNGTSIGRRRLALGAVVALLLAAFAGFGQQQAADAAITTPPTAVTVAQTSPPPGGVIYYGLKFNVDGSDTDETPGNDFQIQVTNLAGFDVAATAAASHCNIGGNGRLSSNSSLVEIDEPSPGSACSITGFGTSVTFGYFDEQNQSGEVTVYVGLVVSSTATPGTTLQPTLTVIQGTDSVSLQAPARTVGVPTVTASVSEANVGDTVTFTFTLPPGWLCEDDTAPNRACADGVDTDVVPDALTLSNLNYVSSSLTGTSASSTGTLTVKATVASLGTATASLNVEYVGDTGTTVGTNDDNTLPTGDPASASVLVWLGIGAPTPALDFDGGATSYTVNVANLTGSNRSAGQATVKITLPAEFSSVSAPSPAPTDWSCSASGNDVTCTNTAPFITGGTAAFTVSGVLSGNTGAASRNITVQAQADFTVPPVGSTSRTASRTDSQPAAGSVNITADPTVLPSSASGVIEYEVSVDNGTGSSIPAADVSFEFKAPAGSVSTAVSVTPGSGWSCTVADAETVNCTRTAALPSGSTSVDVGTFVVQVPANTSATLVTRTATGTLSLTIGSATYQAQGSANVLHPGTGATSVTYNLVLGWNLITWNGKDNVAVDSADGLGSISGSFTAVYTFDAATQTWRFWFPGGGAVNTIAGLEYGTAYFIYVTTPTSLTVPSGP